jgi:hypothetical protein
VQHTDERPLDELTLQIYPEGASRFELYEDDGRTQAYRRGRYALTAITCDARAERLVVRVEPPAGDRSGVPSARRYVLRLRAAPPRAVIVEGVGLLQPSSDEGPAGWWMDAGFLCIRPPGPAFTVVVTPGAP